MMIIRVERTNRKWTSFPIFTKREPIVCTLRQIWAKWCVIRGSKSNCSLISINAALLVRNAPKLSLFFGVILFWYYYSFPSEISWFMKDCRNKRKMITYFGQRGMSFWNQKKHHFVFDSASKETLLAKLIFSAGSSQKAICYHRNQSHKTTKIRCNEIPRCKDQPFNHNVKTSLCLCIFSTNWCAPFKKWTTFCSWARLWLLFCNLAMVIALTGYSLSLYVRRTCKTKWHFTEPTFSLLVARTSQLTCKSQSRTFNCCSRPRTSFSSSVVKREQVRPVKCKCL